MCVLHCPAQDDDEAEEQLIAGVSRKRRKLCRGNHVCDEDKAKSQDSCEDSQAVTLQADEGDNNEDENREEEEEEEEEEDENEGEEDDEEDEETDSDGSVRRSLPPHAAVC